MHTHIFLIQFNFICLLICYSHKLLCFVQECPTCRKKLVSKRSLRPDPNFDLLISKIYPSRDEYEVHQERVLAKLNNSHSQAALVNSITEGIKLQSQNRPHRSRKNLQNNNPATSAETSNVTSQTGSANQSDSSQSGRGDQITNGTPRPSVSPGASGNYLYHLTFTLRYKDSKLIKPIDVF